MANSHLITLGLGGNLITHGMGGITIEVVEPVVQNQGGGGGFVVPQAILIARAKVQIKHVNPIISRIKILTENLIVKSTIPVKIRKIAVSFKVLVAGATIQSFVNKLTLKMTNTGIDIDESKS